MRNEALKLLNQTPIAFMPIYRDLTGSVTAGLYLSQLMYWFSKKEKFYKTDKDLMQETHLSSKEFETAKKKIKALPFITVTKEGIPGKTNYKIDWDRYAFTLETLAKSISPKGGNYTPQNRGTPIPQKGEPNTNTTLRGEREDFFSINEKSINAYIKETIALDKTIKNKRAYERKLLDKFMREDEATIYTFKQWLLPHQADIFTAKYKGKRYAINNGEDKTEATLNRVMHNGGKFIAEFRANNGQTLHLSADDIERLQVFLKGGINANRE